MSSESVKQHCSGEKHKWGRAKHLEGVKQAAEWLKVMKCKNCPAIEVRKHRKINNR